MTLFRQYFRAQFSGLLIWGAVATFLAILLAKSTPQHDAAQAMQEMIAKLPETVKVMFGLVSGLGAADGFVALKVGPSIQLILCMYAVLTALSIVTREIDRRTVDFLLSMPVDRSQVLLARTGVMAVNTGILGALMWTALRVTFGAMGLAGSFGRYAAMIFAIWLMAMAFGAIALFSSMWIDDYSFGVRLWLGLVAGGYFLELILRAAGLTRWQRFFSPYSYADGTRILQDGLPAVDMVVLALVVLTAIALAIPQFNRKQISA